MIGNTHVRWVEARSFAALRRLLRVGATAPAGWNPEGTYAVTLPYPTGRLPESMPIMLSATYSKRDDASEKLDGTSSFAAGRRTLVDRQSNAMHATHAR